MFLQIISVTFSLFQTEKGTFFIRWGRTDCPHSFSLLYSGKIIFPKC